MNKRQPKAAETQKPGHWTNSRQFKIWGPVIAYMFCFYMIFASKSTFINAFTIILISAIPGVLISVFTTKKIKDFLANAFCISWLIGSLFFFTNQLFGEKPIPVKLSIIRSYTGKRSSKYVEVEFGVISKSIPVSSSSDDLFKNARFLHLTLKKGLWGYYYVVEEGTLSKN